MTETHTQFRFDNKMNFDFYAPLPGNANMEAALEQFVGRELVRGLAEQDRAYFFEHALGQETAQNLGRLALTDAALYATELEGRFSCP